MCQLLQGVQGLEGRAGTVHSVLELSGSLQGRLPSSAWLLLTFPVNHICYPDTKGLGLRNAKEQGANAKTRARAQGIPTTVWSQKHHKLLAANLAKNASRYVQLWLPWVRGAFFLADRLSNPPPLLKPGHTACLLSDKAHSFAFTQRTSNLRASKAVLFEVLGLPRCDTVDKLQGLSRVLGLG